MKEIVLFISNIGQIQNVKTDIIFMKDSTGSLSWILVSLITLLPIINPVGTTFILPGNYFSEIMCFLLICIGIQFITINDIKDLV